MPAKPSRWASARATTTSPCCSWRMATATLADNGLKSSRTWPGRWSTPSRASRSPRFAIRPARSMLKPAERCRGHKTPWSESTCRAPRPPAFAARPIPAAGKTGTAQVRGNQDRTRSTTPARLAEHQRDHALFMAFAPADDPKIALAMMVENAGFGAPGRSAHRAPGFRLLAAGPVPQRGRHGRCAKGAGYGADRQTAARAGRALAAGSPDLPHRTRRSRSSESAR